MPTDNKLRDLRATKGLSQAQVADELPDNASNVMVGFLEAGRVLPTIDGMKALCNLFDCTPTDLYAEKDLDLLQSTSRILSIPRPKRGRGHDGMTEFRTWMEPEEKAALERAIKRMGYRNGAEWFREAYRRLLKECISHGVSDNSSPTIVSLVNQDEIQTSIGSL